MSTVSLDHLIDTLRGCRLLTAGQLAELGKGLPCASQSPEAFAQDLVSRDWLTGFQAKQLLLGRGGQLVFGPYVILERLGEGGAGQVYKARHQAMGRIVALKVLRKDLLSDADAVGRFYREVEVISQLAHPAMVRAYDAGVLGSTPFLVLEYLEGLDLEQMVQKSGPLPLAQACDYVRQAALGLQYAHERGLVHRDIKPSNLFLSQTSRTTSLGGPRSAPAPWGTVKILDLGLARLREPVLHSRTTLLTMAGSQSVTMGTPDYLAPEQALDFHAADIRADVYSLGCTFCFLLTGAPPFSGGTVAQKLMAHQQAELPALVDLRRRLPPAHLRLLQQMLAKQPTDRPQLPLEVARALAASPPTEAATVSDDTLNGGEQRTCTTPNTLPCVDRVGRPLRRRRAAPYLIGASAALLLLVGSLAVFARFTVKPVALASVAEPATVAEMAPARPTTPAPPLPTLLKMGEPLASIVSVESHKKYDLAVARLGALYRIDREYKIATLSPGLDGATLLRTANDDKNATGPQHVVLTLGRPATVYIAYDRRGTKLPAWLYDRCWKLTTESFVGSGGDAAAGPMKVYARSFAAGRVALGGNHQPPANGAQSNYVVLIKADD